MPHGEHSHGPLKRRVLGDESDVSQRHWEVRSDLDCETIGRWEALVRKMAVEHYEEIRTNVLELGNGALTFQKFIVCEWKPSGDRVLCVGQTFYWTIVCLLGKRDGSWTCDDGRFYSSRAGSFGLAFIDAGDRGEDDEDRGEEDIVLRITNHPGTDMWVSTLHIVRMENGALIELLNSALDTVDK
jgi:hypothetical protein